MTFLRHCLTSFCCARTIFIYYTAMAFFKENLHKLQDENEEHMPIGFEVAFPSLLNIARSLNIEVPYDSPILKDIFAMRDQKLKK